MMTLKELEIKHGGRHRITQVNGKVNQGGDRFTWHDYESFYMKHLPKDPKVIVEVGVLTGTGLRIWSDYFPNARIIGLDIFPENVKEPGRAEVYYFDQLNPVLPFDTEIDVLIDDGLHTVASQVATYNFFKPYVTGVHIIEDIDKGHNITKEIPEAIQSGRIAVIKEEQN